MRNSITRWIVGTAITAAVAVASAIGGAATTASTVERSFLQKPDAPWAHRTTALPDEPQLSDRQLLRGLFLDYANGRPH